MKCDVRALKLHQCDFNFQKYPSKSTHQKEHLKISESQRLKLSYFKIGYIIALACVQSGVSESYHHTVTFFTPISLPQVWSKVNK